MDSKKNIVMILFCSSGIPVGSGFSPVPKIAHIPGWLLSGFPKRQGSHKNQLSRQPGRGGRGVVGSTAHPKGLDGVPQPWLQRLG